MPFTIVRNDITAMQVDAIVNSTHSRPQIGLGVDNLIHKKAGPMLFAARLGLGTIPLGTAAATAGFRLRAKYVIHTAAPVWQGGTRGEEALLESCYRSCLELARKKGCSSIAFPLLSSHNNGFPKAKALQIALNAISGFLLEGEMMVYLVVFSKDTVQLSEQLFRGITSFLDEAQVLQLEMDAYEVSDRRMLEQARYSRAMEMREYYCAGEAAVPPAPKADRPAKKQAAPKLPKFSKRAVAKAPEPELAMPKAAAPMVLEDMLRLEDRGFSETLLDLMDKTGKKDSEIYSRANVSRQHFSKIRNNPQYRPTKATAIAFAIALELDMEGTRDLIGRAGYVLTRSSKFDLIIMYFIQSGNYNMFDINAALFEFDQPLLGA